MGLSNRILVVDDDENICEMVRLTLEAQDFQVETVLDGDAGLEKATTGDYQVVVLDIMLPGKDGLEICQEIRNSPNRGVPVIMLTAKGEEVDRVLGLELGADDYITKPFSPRELAARVKALLRRYDHYNPAKMSFEEGGLQVNLHEHSATLNSQELVLTPKEMELLAFLMRHRGKSFARGELLKEIWDYDAPVDSTRTVDEHIKRLRNKIGRIDPDHAYIQTVWGHGYKFEVKKV